MEINIPTASPFFTGISNQIMYCISTPNLPTWNAANAYNHEHQKKTENPSIIQSVSNSQNAPPQNQATTQYYYGNSNAAIAQNIQAFNQAYQPVNLQQQQTTSSNEVTKTNTTNYADNNDQNKSQQERENRFFSDDNRSFECAVCQKKFRQKGTLVQHERIHLDLKPYACPHCEKRFRQKAILNQHARIHSDASSQLVYKNLGNNSGTLWPQNVPYPDEIRSEKSQDRKETTPQIAHSVFSADESSNREDSRSGKNSMPLYVRCPICQQEFKQKSTLVQRGCIHIESRPYSCLVINCGKRFRQQSHLQQHNRIHLNLKPYQCPYQDCQKYFRQQTILNQHIRVHNGTKPYRCKTCFKEFRQQAILSQHEKSHMSSTLGCPLTNCKRRFVTENDLRKHIEQHMNPSKPKKQQSTAKSSDFKPDITFAHHQTYPPLYFNPTTIHQPKN